MSLRPRDQVLTTHKVVKIPYLDTLARTGRQRLPFISNSQYSIKLFYQPTRQVDTTLNTLKIHHASPHSTLLPVTRLKIVHKSRLHRIRWPTLVCQSTSAHTAHSLDDAIHGGTKATLSSPELPQDAPSSSVTAVNLYGEPRAGSAPSMLCSKVSPSSSSLCPRDAIQAAPMQQPILTTRRPPRWKKPTRLWRP